jgi:putative hydrolase of the HAD superfamily
VTAAQHRAAFTGQTVAALTGLVPDPESAAARLYARHMQPEAWEAYPDAEGVLKELRRRGVPVAVVSNIGWDLRPVFVAHGLDVHVDSYVLSYELEVQKPDPRIFRAACGAIGVRPDEALMVGDDLAADGGAVRVGCAFHRVLPLTPAERPNALEEVLGLVGAGAQ